MGDISEAGLKRRMKERLSALDDWTLKRLAKATGDDYKNVVRWVSEATTVPADFLARYVSAVPVNPVWLLTGDGVPDPLSDGSEMESGDIDAWGAARARAVEKLTDLLLADQKVLERRADAAWSVAEATRIDAEKAPNRSGPSISSDQIAAFQRAAETMELLAPILQAAAEGTLTVTPRSND